MNLIGIDIGGTKILIILTDETGKIKNRVELPTPKGSPALVLDKIVQQLKLCEKFKSIGVGIAGDIDSKNGIVRHSPNLHKWTNVHLKKYFEVRTNVRTVVDNDANCAAVGSYILDGKKKYKNFITITLGTGIGGGFITNGELYRGSTGSAGEAGHITINQNGPRCSCGNYGCLESYIGTKGIIRIAIKQGLKNKNLTPAVIAELARNGNKKAVLVYQKTAEYLAVGTGNLINIFNPDMITFSGGVSANWDLIKKPFFTELKKRVFTASLKHVKIIKSKHAKNLGAIGAALLSKKSD
ncbi:MAG: ROK family protein [Elusimicrobiota bacterium]